MIMMFMVLCSKFGKFEGSAKGFEGVKRSMWEVRIGITEGPRLTRFLGLGKNVFHETHVSGTVLWSPTNTKSPTYTYISQ